MTGPGGNGGSGGIDLYPDDLNSAAGVFAKGQTDLDTAATALNTALQNAGGMAGNDDYGQKFGHKYDPAAKALFHTLSAAIRAVGQASEALVTTANNYLKADHHSNAKKGKGAPRLYPPPVVFTDIMYPDPASAIGPGHSSVPSVIAKYWPNGHQDKLRDAATAYRTASSAFQTLGHTLHTQVQSLTDNNSDESVKAMAAFWAKIWQDGGGTQMAPLSAAHDACDKLATACDKFAEAIDKAHSSTEKKLAGAGIAVGLTTALGVALTIFTGGGSDAGAAALDGAEAGAILGGVETAAEATIAEIDTTVIADIGTELETAAEAVPEIETVDAETTEVDQALSDELKETETEHPSEEPEEAPAEAARYQEAAGKTPEPVPEGWEPRVADNGKGVVFQRAGAEGNADMVRVMDPTARYPDGYIRVYNSEGQPVDINGKPGPKPATHIPIGQSWKWWPK